MVTKEELMKLDKVFIQRQEGTYPPWNCDMIEERDNTFIDLGAILSVHDNYISIQGISSSKSEWTINHDCLFTEDKYVKGLRLAEDLASGVLEFNFNIGAESIEDRAKDMALWQEWLETLEEKDLPDTTCDIGIPHKDLSLYDTLAEKGVFDFIWEDIKDEHICGLELDGRMQVKTPDTISVSTRNTRNDWTASHYDVNYKLTEEDIAKGSVRIDAYFVNRIWKVNSWDDTGAAFHILKTFPRVAKNKNELKRELTAIVNQAKILAKAHGVDLCK